MGALVRRKSFDHVTVAFFVIYLAGLCARKFYQLVFDEANMASDWTTNFMRRYAFQGVGAIFVLIGVIVLLDLIGFVTGDSSPWEGMQEYTMGLMFMSAVYSLYMWKLESIDSAFCVAMLVFTLGLVFGLPFKLLVHLFGIYSDSWNIGLIVLFLYVCFLSFYSVQYQRRRRQNESKGEGIKDKLYDDMLRNFADTVRYSQTLYYWAMAYWFFQIEEYLEKHDVGWAALTFYYVLALHFVLGCCKEFRENDF